MSDVERESPPTVTSSRKPPRTLACVLCQQRKVKCDRKFPCNTCIKTGVQCVPVAAPRQRRRRFPEGELLQRVRHLEDLLRQNNIEFEPLHATASEKNAPDGGKQNEGSEGASPEVKTETTFEAKNLWHAMSQKVQPNRGLSLMEKVLIADDQQTNAYNDYEDDEDNDDDEDLRDVAGKKTWDQMYKNSTDYLLFGSRIMDIDLSTLHPDHVQIFKFWQTFLENVNPPVKILHTPTVQKIILGVASGLSKTMPANKEALCFCIYLIAICSVPHCNHDECERVMGQPMDESIDLYTGLAQQALVNARFIQKPNFTTLQAFALFLVSQRTRFEPNVLWQLTGLAIRAAQQMGYHREQALKSPSVSIFQAELRRRLWWELVLLESFSAKQCGVRSIVSSRSFWDTKRPLNINDTDLHPEMCHSLEDYRGMTEMSFCSARFEIGSFTIDHSGMDKSSQNVDEVDSRIEELLKGLHDRLLKYCDPSVPMHNMLLLFSRGATTRVKLTVRRHHMYAKGAGLSLEERDKTFLLCLQLTEVPNSFSKNKEIQKFIWQAMAFFPLDALLFMLGEIAYRTEQPPPDVDRAWEEIERSFELQPRLLHDESNAMYSAVRNLTLKAWDRSVNRQWIGLNVPRFIQLLRSRSLAIRSTDSSVNLTGTSGVLDTLDESLFNFDTESLNPSWNKIVIPDDPEFWAYWQQFDAELSGV
ncbi:hypothetical protein D6D18_07105 [Aureobasidium pullulans]|nr:hypothetical protein D6D18_07105 [Aureobasidium pullulans]